MLGLILNKQHVLDTKCIIYLFRKYLPQAANIHTLGYHLRIAQHLPHLWEKVQEAEEAAPRVRMSCSVETIRLPSESSCLEAALGCTDPRQVQLHFSGEQPGHQGAGADHGSQGSMQFQEDCKGLSGQDMSSPS